MCRKCWVVSECEANQQVVDEWRAKQEEVQFSSWFTMYIAGDD